MDVRKWRYEGFTTRIENGDGIRINCSKPTVSIAEKPKKSLCSLLR